ncbi:SDR family NAD(P)-dependent oxidoreductase [Altererythrobacter sp. H2]|uniref:SDR family NAD(P)-dependent oxidoreductase n=1 Tax=Altererythrobacter sp. H2 TaxID=3108391 RepID=UPI002B4C1752|nr:SDR family NAD(P)-dependent oxidoreductase [Altererythrobacter sp. H2]WRK95728.1 SDR family NAD(P)-dependent oxidoreductase [Altererythrobacter sp. H2]
MAGYGATTTADEVLAGIDLAGQTVFVTGGASGIGQEAARAMAARGARVVLAARDQAKLDAAADSIRAAVPGASVETIVVDLASLASVRACGAEAAQRFPVIDLLINNAGVMACPHGETADGFELQFGTNHLGHFLLTKYLAPLVEAGRGKRIVNLSSLAHHYDRVHFDDPNYRARPYDKWESYGQSKTANVLFSVGLQQRLAARGFDIFAVHPGGIATNLGRHLTEQDVAEMMARIQDRAGGSFSFKTIEQGAATTCWAATAPDLTGNGGVYCEDCHVAPVDDVDPRGGVRSYAVDPDAAEQLWTLSEELVGEAFSV